MLYKISKKCRDQNTFAFAQLVESKALITEPRNSCLKFLVKQMMSPKRRRKILSVQPSKIREASYISEQIMP